MAALPSPRVVLFDLDDTLFDHATAARAALLGVHRAHTCFAAGAFEAFEREHTACLEDLHRRVIASEMTVDEARIERFRRLFEAAGVRAGEELLHDTAMRYRRAYLDARSPIAGAHDLLTALKPRVAIGIVSNNVLEEQQAKLRHCRFESLIDVLVVSEEAGVSKPDPAIFRIALDRLAAGPDEAVMVGDSWAADVEGARAAGIRAVWFNRFGHPQPLAEVRALQAFVPLATAIDVILGGPSATTPNQSGAIECRA